MKGTLFYEIHKSLVVKKYLLPIKFAFKFFAAVSKIRCNGSYMVHIGGLMSIVLLLLIVSCNSFEGGTELVFSEEEAPFYDLSKVAQYQESYKPSGRNGRFYTADGKMANYYAKIPKKPNQMSLFVVHDKYGLTDEIRKEVDRLFDFLGGKVAVFAPNFYDGVVAQSDEEAERLLNSIESGRIEAIIHSYIGGLQLEASKYGSQPQMGVIAWGEGGNWALKTATMAEEKVKGCVFYYDFPKGKEEAIKDSKAKVLIIQDDSPNGKMDSGVDRAIHSFDKGSGFANPKGQGYDARAATQANKLVLDFLNQLYSVEKK